MSPNSTICDIVHHACRTRAHCPTIISNFKLSLRTVCLPRFCHIADQIHKEKSCRLVGFNLMHCCTDTSGIAHHAR